MRLDGFEVVIFLDVFPEVAKAGFERPRHGEGNTKGKAVVRYVLCQQLGVYM